MKMLELQQKSLRSRAPAFFGRPVEGMTGTVVRGCDLGILCAAFFSVIVLPYFSQNELVFTEFLLLRISIRNLIVANLCFWSWHLILVCSGVYAMHRTKSMTTLTVKLMLALTACTGLVGLLLAIHGETQHMVRAAGVFWLVSLALTLLLRVVLACYHRFLKPLMRRRRSLIIVGTGPQGQRAFSELKLHPEWNYELLGFVDSEPQLGDIPDEMILGGMDQLEDILMQNVVDEVIIVLPMKSQYENIGRAVALCEVAGVQSQYSGNHFGTDVTKRRVIDRAGQGRVVMQVVHHDVRRYLKRAVDVVGAMTGLILLSPLMVLAALAVKTSPGPVFFSQERYGWNKRKFRMYKFRSMVEDAEAKQETLEHLNETTGPAFKIKNDPRVTKVGAFMRKMSIDELPQLFNVLLGDMSLVGPRPLPLRDVSRFSEARLMRRFSMKPGLTCLWQINGRSGETSFEQWVKWDLEYIDKWSLLLDAEILLRTVPAVLKGRGAV